MESTDLYGLVPEEQAPAVVNELEARGITDDGIEVHPAEPGRYELHDERFYEEGISARHGGLLGLVAGVLAGPVVTLLVPTIGGLRDMLIAAAVFGGFGIIVGVMAGVATAARYNGDPVEYERVDPDDDLAVVEVHNEHFNRRAHRILQHLGVRFIQEPHPN